MDATGEGNLCAHRQSQWVVDTSTMVLVSQRKFLGGYWCKVELLAQFHLRNCWCGSGDRYEGGNQVEQRAVHTETEQANIGGGKGIWYLMVVM